MLSIIADALMTASRTKTCGGWSECRSVHPPTFPRHGESAHRHDPVARKWLGRVGER